MKIILPVDGSIYTKRMLSYVATHESMFGREHDYLVMTVVMAVPTRAARFVDHATIDDWYREEAEQVLGPAKAFAEQAGWRVRTKYGAGRASEVIAATIEAELPDLVVMGSHGHSALKGAVLGSVASGVLARSTAPLLLVR